MRRFSPAAELSGDPPGFWMNETSGVLRPAVEAYLRLRDWGEPGTPDMTPPQIAAMRAYLRQWIMAPAWRGPEVDELRASVHRLDSRAAIDAWLDRAIDAGIDPL